MTYAQLVDAISTILPNATFDEDNDGQLIIYTDMKQVGKDDEELVSLPPYSE